MLGTNSLDGEMLSKVHCEERLNCMESLEAAMAVASGAAQDLSGRLVHKIIG